MHKILAVDDTVTSLFRLAQLMSDQGFEVICAKSGKQALDLLNGFIPDLILLDVNMPDLDGVELCHRIKQKPPLQSVPVIFQSVATDAETKIQGLKAGAADFVSKPYQPEEILLRVRTHLELHSLRSDLEEAVETRTRQLEAEVQERRLAEQELIASRQKLRDLSAHLEVVREEERKNIAREIHDALGQSLTVAQIELKRLAGVLPQTPEEIDARVDSLQRSLAEASDIARSLSENLRPGTLDVLGLKPALEDHIRKFTQATGIAGKAHFELPEEMEIEDRYATAIFRIAQESLTNVARHANATEVVVKLLGGEDGLILMVQDNGMGVGEKRSGDRHGFGLQGMQERTEMLGGSFLVDSEQGRGTLIEAFFPLRELCIDD